MERRRQTKGRLMMVPILYKGVHFLKSSIRKKLDTPGDEELLKTLQNADIQ